MAKKQEQIFILSSVWNDYKIQEVVQKPAEYMDNQTGQKLVRAEPQIKKDVFSIRGLKNNFSFKDGFKPVDCNEFGALSVIEEDVLAKVEKDVVVKKYIEKGYIQIFRGGKYEALDELQSLKQDSKSRPLDSKAFGKLQAIEQQGQLKGL